MTLLVYAVDLGTTNLKVVLFDDRAQPLAAARAVMQYAREGDRVEFDPDAVFERVVDLMHRCAVDARIDGREHAVIAVTGQAESLVLVDAVGSPVAPGISWMDERSGAQALEIEEQFGAEAGFAVTGQPSPVPTWPATKLRWLAQHEPEALDRAHRVLMIKDFVLLRLTGVAVGEETTRGFTYLYDVPARAYWGDMVEFCGARLEQLPELVSAGTDLGAVLPDIADRLPIAASYSVNAGALDHFSAMAGTGSYRPNAVNASAGTVLALSMLVEDWRFDPAMAVSFHAGLHPDETVLFTCADSGGVALDWFQRDVTGAVAGYEELEVELGRRHHGDAPIFLPFLTGVNPPDFNAAARGAFVDLHLRHDRVDLAFAVMEGVAHLLRSNLDDLASHGHPASSIVSSGGGTASAFWNQLKADVCGLELHVPDEAEAASRGAALMALAAAGAIESIHDTGSLPDPGVRIYRPRPSPGLATRFDRFATALHRLYGP